MAAIAGSHIADTSVNCSCCSLLLVGDDVGVESTPIGIKKMTSTLRRRWCIEFYLLRMDVSDRREEEIMELWSSDISISIFVGGEEKGYRYLFFMQKMTQDIHTFSMMSDGLLRPIKATSIHSSTINRCYTIYMNYWQERLAQIAQEMKILHILCIDTRPSLCSNNNTLPPLDY